MMTMMVTMIMQKIRNCSC